MESTQGQIDGIFGQLQYKCHRNRVEFVGQIDLIFAPGLPPEWIYLLKASERRRNKPTLFKNLKSQPENGLTV